MSKARRTGRRLAGALWVRSLAATEESEASWSAPEPARGPDDLRILEAQWNVYDHADPTEDGGPGSLRRWLTRLARRALRRVQGPVWVQQAGWNRAATRLILGAEQMAADRARDESRPRASPGEWQLERLRACEERLAALERELTALRAEVDGASSRATSASDLAAR